MTSSYFAELSRRHSDQSLFDLCFFGEDPTTVPPSPFKPGAPEGADFYDGVFDSLEAAVADAGRFGAMSIVSQKRDGSATMVVMSSAESAAATEKSAARG